MLHSRRDISVIYDAYIFINVDIYVYIPKVLHSRRVISVRIPKVRRAAGPACVMTLMAVMATASGPLNPKP